LTGAVTGRKETAPLTTDGLITVWQLDWLTGELTDQLTIDCLMTVWESGWLPLWQADWHV